MDLSPYINQLRDDLTAAASTGDEQARQTAAMLSGAIEPAARLALMSALSDLAAEVTTHLDGPVVEVRLDGRDIRTVVTGASEAEPGPAEEPAPPRPGDPGFAGGGGDISRITLRLLDEIKGQAEEAASSQGVSLNTWVAQAVQGALHGRQAGPWANRPGHGPWNPGRGPWRSDSGSGSRLRGWIQG